MANNPEKELKKIVGLINKHLEEAEKIANKHELSFSIYPEYGMGGTYDGSEGRWYPSSQSC